MNITVRSLNELLGMIEKPLNDIRKRIPGIVYRIPNGIAFYNENYRKHLELIQKLYFSDQRISDNLSRTEFTNYIIDELKEKYKQGSQFTDLEVNRINDFFNSLEIKSIIVCSEIQGVITLKMQSIKKGDFIITPWSLRKEVEDEMGSTFAEFFNKDIFENLIRIKVQAIDLEKAKEKAKTFFEYLENILHVIIGYPDERYSISISKGTQSNSIPCIAYSSDQEFAWTHGYNKQYIEPFILDDEYLEDSIFIELIILITKNNQTQLEKQILLAAYWLGQAIRGNIVIDGYLKACIALEVIFTRSDDGPLPPTTLYKIAESTALLLSKNSENAIQIEQEIRDLYSKRSSIVHSGNTDVNRSLYLKICDYSRALIFNLIQNSFFGCKSNKELIEYLKQQKYKKSI